MYNLRDYQIEFISKTRNALKDHRSVLSVMPTGGGKTICFAEMCRLCGEQGRSALILAHTDELCAQAVDKLQRSVNIFAGIEKAKQRCSEDNQIVVGSVQTMCRPKRLKTFDASRFDLIIIDEAHRAVSDSYVRIVKHFPKAYVVGVTATGYRGDSKSLGDLFETIAVEIQLKRLIDEGSLSKIAVQTVPLEIDVSGIKQKGTEYDATRAAHVVEPYLDAAADAIRQYAPNRKGMVFLPLIETSQKMADALKEAGFSAEHIDGKSNNRREILGAFRRGDIQILTNPSLLSEGFDEPALSMIMVLRPIRSRGRYVQMIGRGTRICDGKENLLILDPLFQGAKHNLCTPASLVAKNGRQDYDTKEKLRDGDEQMDLLKVYGEAVQGIEDALREAAERASRRKARCFNPLDVADWFGDRELAFYTPGTRWEAAEASAKQLAMIEGSGIDTDAVTCKGHASKLIEVIMARRDRGLCTLKQVRVMKKHGIVDAETFTFDHASATLDSLFG